MSNATNNLVQQITNEQKIMAMPLSEMMKKVATEPKSKFIYSGIKENSVGIIVGPSKTGKTMYGENLGMAIAAGLTSYLGHPIDIENRKVLILSFEEHYTLRTERNAKQAEKLIASHGDAWMENYIVATEEMPTYISTLADWLLLADTIAKYNPGVVILDSVTHMCEGIEDSSTAQAFTKKLRELSRITNTTILAIHHTHKMFGRPLTIDNIAGSRVVGQELDFMIGINRTLDGKRYIKDVAFRYSANDKDTVTTFTIDDDCWLNVTGEEYEHDLLKEPDGRRDNSNGDKITAYLSEKMETEIQTAGAGELQRRFVPGEMSRTALFDWLKKLVKAGKITETNGQYKLAG